MENTNIPSTLKILCVGNSFAWDTMWHLPGIARAAGVREFKLAFLYVGGCSIKRHLTHADGDLPAYQYHVNCGGEWEMTPEVRIREAVVEEKWDWISIQHGTGDGSCYTEPASYEGLPRLIEYVKGFASPETKIAFNMAWVPEPDREHHEMIAYKGDQTRMFQNLVALTESLVKPTKGLDRVSPTGTAVQNARTVAERLLTRDGFHVSYDWGRYLAGITFFNALTGVTLESLDWMPEGVSEHEREIALRAAALAVQTPFALTDMN